MENYKKPPIIASCKLPTGDGVNVGVPIEPWAVFKQGDQSLSFDDLPEEGSPNESSTAGYRLRLRWFRSLLPRGGAVCSAHPEQEAVLQCIVCVKYDVPAHLSYHCSIDCLKSHWQLHKEYHNHHRAIANGEKENDIAKMEHAASTSSLNDGWMEVHKGRAYSPTLHDIGYTLKFEIQILDKTGKVLSAKNASSSVQTSRVRPTPNPPARQMVRTVPTVQDVGQGIRISILSYNLLADLYAKQADFAKHCPAWVLHWNYRSRNLLREMTMHKADIICLQEVQNDHFASFWWPELSKLGYVPIYKKKSTEMFADNKYVIDGCATFFKKDRFQLVKKYEVEFNKAAVSLVDSISNQAQKSAVLSRLLKDNVALILVLEVLEAAQAENGGRRLLICVSNTHIHANPEFTDVKLWQVHTLLRGLEKIAASAPDIPMFVAGDFNSTPDSATHKLLVKGRVEPEALHKVDPSGFLRDLKLSHSLPLQSAYSAMYDAHGGADGRLQRQKARLDPQQHEPMFTNLSHDFKGTLDYILFTTNSLRTTAVLELPAEADIIKNPRDQLPNAQYSSDHIALLAEFQYIR